MKVSFRTDASLEIGTGHVMRCLTLARALRAEGANCRFVSRALKGHLSERVKREGFEVSLLPEPHARIPEITSVHARWARVTWEQDAQETRSVLEQDTPDWLVVDHYAFDAQWERSALLKGIRLMVIDDLADRPHDCHLLVDQSLGRKPSDYAGLVPDNCQCLIGPRYALLRPEFSEIRAQALANREERGLQHLLISMGGVDKDDATSAVLDILKRANLPREMRITVIMGSAAPALDQVITCAQEMPWPTEVVVDVTDMATRMASADLAIGAAGSTTWERCCLGLPTIIVEIAKNQVDIAEAMAMSGAAFRVGGLHDDEFEQSLHSALIDVRDNRRLAEVSRRAADTCDGDGVARILNLLLDRTLTFRVAERSDSRRVWEWRRSVNRTHRMADEDTPFLEHDAWFRRAILDPARHIHIATLGDLPCGYLRLDRVSGSSARVSLCLSPDARGRGLGLTLLEEAGRLAIDFGFERLEAEIHSQNLASRRVFEGAGYSEGNTVDGFVRCHRVLPRVA